MTQRVSRENLFTKFDFKKCCSDKQFLHYTQLKEDTCYFEYGKKINAKGGDYLTINSLGRIEIIPRQEFELKFNY